MNELDGFKLYIWLQIDLLQTKKQFYDLKITTLFIISVFTNYL